MNKKQTVRVLPGAALLSSLVLVGACATNPVVEKSGPKAVDCGQLPNDVSVDIILDAAGCPVDADPNQFPVANTKAICWQSVNTAGEKINGDYELWFEPFRGQPFKANGQGIVRLQLNPDAPATEVNGIEYKYTIEGKGCPGLPGTPAKYKDPRFTVRR
jgi:hypothetical protein